MPNPKTGVKVKLVPYNPEAHAESVMLWYYDVRYESFFRDFEGRAYSLDDCKKLAENMGQKGVGVFTIIDKESHAPIGLMTWECLKKKAKVFRWGILLDKEHQHKTYAIEAIILLGFYLIENHGMKKYAIEFLESDKHIQRIATQGGFTCEATLINEGVIDGKLVNEVRYYITPETAYELYGSYYASLDELEENKKSDTSG